MRERNCEPIVSRRYEKIIAKTTFSDQQKRKGMEIMNCVECKSEKFIKGVVPNERVSA